MVERIRFEMFSSLSRTLRNICASQRRQSYALNDLDRRLEPFMSRAAGLIVEAGANNGIRQSNSLYFERHLGWKCLLIEAIPELAEQCRKNRPKSLVENCALVASDYPDDEVVMHYCNLMSIVRGGMNDSIREESHLKLGRAFLNDTETEYVVSVPAHTLSDVLDRYDVRSVDLLSLDVEGYEAKVLNGIDFARHRPRLMLIEVWNRREVECVIDRWYDPIAVLHMNDLYEDVLYRVKEKYE